MTTALFENRETGPFDGDKLRADLETAHLLDQLAEHPAWTTLTELLEREATAHERWLVQGKCDGMEEYRYRAGYVKGLRSILATPETFSQRVHERARQAALNEEDS